MREELDCFVFYFDLIGMRVILLDDLRAAIERLEEFQRLVRTRTEIQNPAGTVITLADNVWARIAADETRALTSVVKNTLRAAEECGFDAYFGAVTRGSFIRDLGNQELVTGSQPTDILKQHIGMTCDPHLRAAMAEKWAAGLAKANKLPAPDRSIWVSEEVSLTPFDGLKSASTFDLATLPLNKPWPFKRSKFTALVS